MFSLACLVVLWSQVLHRSLNGDVLLHQSHVLCNGHLCDGRVAVDCSMRLQWPNCIMYHCICYVHSVCCLITSCIPFRILCQSHVLSKSMWHSIGYVILIARAIQLHLSFYLVFYCSSLYYLIPCFSPFQSLCQRHVLSNHLLHSIS